MPNRTESEFLAIYGFEKINSREKPDTWMSVVKSEGGSRFPHGRVFNIVVAAVGGELLACSSRIWFEAKETCGGWDVFFYVIYEKDNGAHLLESQMSGEDILECMLQAAAILEIPDEFEKEEKVVQEEKAKSPSWTVTVNLNDSQYALLPFKNCTITCKQK